MAERVREHDATLKATIESRDGRVFKHMGDGACAVLPNPAAAIAAAVEAQRAIAPLGLSARMAVHAGPADERGGDFFGLALSHCARVMDAAHGGQVLISSAAAALLSGGPPAGTQLVDVGVFDLPDFAGERLYQVRAEGLTAIDASPRARPSTARLPTARSRLIGRDKELATVRELVTQTALVTLTGAGGCGKTRLAIEVATQLHVAHRDGAAFADLALITDPAVVAAAIGRAVGMPPSERPDSGLDDLARFLSRKSMLIVLDNCEHVLDAIADVADRMLDECPELKLLATSREAIGVEGERVWRVRSLDREDAVTLFLSRSGDGSVDDADLALVKEICEHLDGLPLAVELAAAQAGHLPLAEINSLLDDRFRLLAGGSRRSRQRHQTLQATMDWSYALLDQRQQAALRCLSVFPGPFDLDGAVGVWPRRDEGRTTVASALGDLIAKSLVVVDPASGRYRLLETVRLYGREKLVESGDTASAHDLHAEWVLSWRQTGRHGGWETSFSEGWLQMATVDADLEDVRAALDWVVGEKRWKTVVQLIGATGPLWFVTTRGAEALRWLEGAAEVDENLPLDDRLRWRATAGYSHVTLMQPFEAIERSREGVALAPAGHPLVPSLLLIEAWMQAWFSSDAAVALCDQIRAIVDDDSSWPPIADYFTGLAALLSEDYASAGSIFTSLAGYGAPPGDTHASATVALHLAGDHGAAAAAAESLGPERSTFLSDLTSLFARVLASIGLQRYDEAFARVADMMDVAASRYPHLDSAWGLALNAAAIVASTTDQHEEALTLLAGTGATGLTARYEGAFASARHYRRLSKAALDDASARLAIDRGKTLNLDQLKAVAERVISRKAEVQ